MGAVVLSIYLLLVGRTEVDPGARAADPLPSVIDDRLNCDPDVPLEVDLREGIDPDGHAVLQGKMTYRRNGSERARKVDFDYYTAKAQRGSRPAVVISPITGGGYEVSRLLANDLVTCGYHAVIVRRPNDVEALRARAKLEAFETELRDAVAARRRVIDWLVKRPEVDARRIGAYGVSLGGVVTAVLAAVEKRIVASVAVMASGDLPELVCRSVEREPRRLARANGISENPTQEEIRAFSKIARPILQTDPALLANHVDPREIFLVIARRDTSVPTDLQYRLHEALGSPASISLPTGHFSAAFYLPVITATARRFLAERFANVDS